MDQVYVEEEQREEQELSAFTLAITQLFGSEQARISERIWLDESDLLDSPPLAADRNLRAVSVAAFFRLGGDRDVPRL